MKAESSVLEILDPNEIGKQETILNELRDYGIVHDPAELNTGWNYVLDQVWVVKKIEKYIKRSSTTDLVVLDVGCGNSMFHNYLERKFNLKIIGIDRPTGFCNIGGQKNVDFQEDFLSLQKFETGSVDLIIWLSAIEHNEYYKIRQLFLKSKRLLRSGGMLLATIGISTKTYWFNPSEQMNLSIEDCKKVFDIQKVIGDFDVVKGEYKEDILFLKEKYTNRYHKFDEKDPEFLVGAVSVIKEASNDISNKHIEPQNRPLNILLYLEPLITQDRPTLYVDWLPLWAQMVGAIDKNPGLIFSIKLITSQSVADFTSHFKIPKKVDIISIPPEKLVTQFDYSSMNASLAWYKDTYTNEQLEYTSQLFADILQGWKPDIIISSSHVPFLKHCFPDAAVLHFEVGMTSRPPFPLSFYLDPMGLYRNSILAKKCDEINSEPLDKSGKMFLEKYRNFFLPLISSKNPFSKFIESYKGKFDYLIMLPLQTEGFWFNGNCNVHSQFQFVHKLLSKIPANIGILVTTHPGNPWITPAIENYFRSSFPNFLFSPDLQKVSSASQYLMDSVDAVLSVSSMVGLQALIWKKRLFGIGETQLIVAAEYCFNPDLEDIQKLPDLLKKTKIDKDNVLFWLLTKFYVPRRYFFNPKWIRNYIIRLYIANKSGKISINDFDFVDNIDMLLSYNIEEAVLEVPLFRDFQVEELTDILRTKDLQLQLLNTKYKQLESTVVEKKQEHQNSKMANLFVSYAQNYEDVMLYRALKGVEKGFYIDVGANDPSLNSVTKAFYERGWRGINIEPVRYWFDKLAEERPEDVNLNIAVSDKSGLMSLYDVVHTGLSTSSHVVAEEHKKTGGFAYQKISVPALTLDDVLKSTSNKDIHFLNIDVEGAEKQVLAGIDLNRNRPWIILVEATKPLSTEPDFGIWDTLLTSRGYSFVYFDGLNRYYLAQERSELQGAFNAPPNIFDDFIRINEANDLALLNTRETEVKQLENLVIAKEADRLQLESLLNAKEADHLQLKAILDAKEVKYMQLENALDTSRQSQAELESHIRKLENDSVNFRSEAHKWWLEADKWWRDADRFRLDLQLVYASHSWRYTAPLRKLHLTENIKKTILAVFLFLRKIPGMNILLNTLRKRFPRIWVKFASSIKNQVPVEPPALVSPTFAPVPLASLEDEQHFLNLFQRELSGHRSGNTDVQ